MCVTVQESYMLQSYMLGHMKPLTQYPSDLCSGPVQVTHIISIASHLILATFEQNADFQKNGFRLTDGSLFMTLLVISDLKRSWFTHVNAPIRCLLVQGEMFFWSIVLQC